MTASAIPIIPVVDATGNPARSTSPSANNPPERDPAAPGQQRLHPRAVSVIAQSVSHLPPLSESASVFLAPDAEYRIRQIVQDALKFMKHSKRTRLSPDDINSALNLRNADPIFGFGPQSRKYNYSRSFPTNPNASHNLKALSNALTSNPLSAHARRLSNPRRNPAHGPRQTDSSSTDLHEAAIPRALNPTQSTPPDPPSFAPVQGIPNLFFASDKERNLTDLIREPLPPVPLEAIVMAHWLAIDSAQPSIPQNPATESNEQNKVAVRTSQPSDISSKRRRVPAIKSFGAITARKKRRRCPPSNSLEKNQSLQVEVKPRIKHNLTRELQLYFDYLRQCIFKNDPDLIENCLRSVANEHGIVQLLPYLSSFVARTVQNHLKDLPLLFTLMRMMNAMVANRAFKLETYLHQMLPACASCIVGKRLCAHPNQDHWALRDLSAGLFRRVCDRFEKDYVDIKRRFVITLGEALDNIGRPLTTHYGAIVGFIALGQLTISKSLISRLPEYAQKVKLVLESANQGPVRRFEAAKVYCALAWAAWLYMEVDENGKGGKLSTVGDNRVKRGKQPSPCISSIQPEIIEHLVPDALRLLPVLQTEFGAKVEPLGEAAFQTEVANRILKEANAPHKGSLD